MYLVILGRLIEPAYTSSLSCVCFLRYLGYISFVLALILHAPLPRKNGTHDQHLPPGRPLSATTFSSLQYNIFSEALGDRGKWDTARVVTIMLAAFHVSTWALELSLDLAVLTDGPVDLMNRPPPVVSSGNPADLGSNFDWIVQVRTVSHACLPQ